METLSQLIQRRMTELDLKKSKLAELVGVSRAYIGDLANGTAKTKNGSYRPKPEIVGKLAKALQISESEILEAMSYLSDNGGSNVPKPILKALAREGKLSPDDEERIADFIVRLKQN